MGLDAALPGIAKQARAGWTADRMLASLDANLQPPAGPYGLLVRAFAQWRWPRWQCGPFPLAPTPRSPAGASARNWMGWNWPMSTGTPTSRARSTDGSRTYGGSSRRGVSPSIRIRESPQLAAFSQLRLPAPASSTSACAERR